MSEGKIVRAGPSQDSTVQQAVSPTQISQEDQLHQTLLQLEAERRLLLRQLLQEVSPSSPQTTLNPSHLPSVHAHSRPLTPLTSHVEAELLNNAQGTIKDHIKLLHQYNEIRDVGLGLIGMVAENRKVRIRDCQEEYGVGEGD